MKARNAAEYAKAWVEHINAFQAVCLDADLPYDKWIELRGQLVGIIEAAANRNADDGVFSDSDIRRERPVG